MVRHIHTARSVSLPTTCVRHFRALNAESSPCSTAVAAVQAIRSDNPVIFFEHVLLYNIKGEAGDKDDVACLERAEVVREGTDVSIFTYSRMRYVVMQAVQDLVKKGYNPEVRDSVRMWKCTGVCPCTECDGCTSGCVRAPEVRSASLTPCACPQVIDLISLKPFDMETISKSVRKTRKVIIVEECMKTGGSHGKDRLAACAPAPAARAAPAILARNSRTCIRSNLCASQRTGT